MNKTEKAQTGTVVNKINLTFSFFQISAHSLFFFLTPVLFHDARLVLLTLAVGVAIIFTNQLWALIHEGIHGFLLPERRSNNLLLSVLSIFFGSSSIFLRAAHLFHHRYSRSDSERVEIYTAQENRVGVSVAYYFSLLSGLYFSELILPFIAFLPAKHLVKIRDRLFTTHSMASHVIGYLARQPRKLRIMRVELLGVLFVFSTALSLFGSNYSFFLAFLFVRAFLISFLDYVYHYGTPIGSNLHGKNLALPEVVSKFLLHFNLHGIHHQNPGLSWVELPRTFKEKKLSYDDGYVRAALEQINGPILKEELASEKSA
ncbi:fatty acid desaturase family protein [Noviherbaspirillum sp.]|uniref:fatty acid desaturase family protein n=1 Tax=Noviherbaspirillum sp. TaxID=1926288 RepID=UPI002FDFB2F3